MFIQFDERTVKYSFPLTHINPNIMSTQAHLCALCGEKKK